MKVLVTGCAGFIGFHVAHQLLSRGDDVVGFDNVNSYYDVALKEARLSILDNTGKGNHGRFTFHREDLTDVAAVTACFEEHRFDRVIHLAAQAGVRHSIEVPLDYVASNLVGFTVLIEACRRAEVAHFTFASTSSVYGANTKLPYSEDDGVDHPLQFYAATKRANELMAHSYAHLYRMPSTGLRFFTVYGPWGRPDMALFKFTKAILEDQPVPVFNNGNHTRAFTYVDDVVEGIIRVSDQIAVANEAWDSGAPDRATSDAPFRILNIGGERPVALLDYVRCIERALGKRAEIAFLPKQPGDVPDSHADVTRLREAVGYAPSTPIETGIERFVDWYLDFYGIEKGAKASVVKG